MIPEAAAAERVAGILSRYVSGVLADEFWKIIGGKVVANRGALRRLFDELDTDPKAITGRTVVLKQQQSGSLSDEDVLLERLADLRSETAQVEAWLRDMRSVNFRDVFDPDEVRADEDDARINRERSIEDAPAIRLDTTS